MSDVSGSRFLEMAGSDNFQRRLNRSAQPTGTRNSSIPGDFTFESPATSSTGSADYSMLQEQPDVDKPSSIQGPGSFGKQIEREKYLEDNNIAQGGSTSKDFVTRYANINKELQSGDATDGSSIANKYIQNAARSNPIDIEALDKQIRRAPLYHHAKSELEGLKTFGDMYRYGRESLPDFKTPAPMEAVEKPDFEGIYNKTKGDIDDIEI